MSVDEFKHFSGGKMPLPFSKKARNFFSVLTLTKISHAISLQAIQFYKRSEPSKKSYQMVSVSLHVHARFHTFYSQKFENHESDMNRKMFFRTLLKWSYLDQHILLLIDTGLFPHFSVLVVEKPEQFHYFNTNINYRKKEITRRTDNCGQCGRNTTGYMAV